MLSHCLSHHGNTSHFCLDGHTLPEVAARLDHRLQKRKDRVRSRIVKDVVDPVRQYEQVILRVDTNFLGLKVK